MSNFSSPNTKCNSHTPGTETCWPQMTHHNLDEHLSWLLSTKATIPSPTSDLPPVPALLASPSELQPRPDETEGARTSHHHQRHSEFPESARPQTAEMVRLRTAPGSASKPNHVSVGMRLPDGASPDNRRYPDSNRGSTSSYSTARTTLAETPSRRYQGVPVISHDVEIMDLTENMGQLRSPTGMRGRKRKSSEFESDVGVPTMRPNARSNPRVPVNQALQHASQQSFTAIDEIVDEPIGPPPPYSTIPPKPCTSRPVVPRNADARDNLFNSGFAAANPREMADSEEDDDELVNFTGSVSKKQRGSTPSVKEKAFAGHHTYSAANPSPSLHGVPTGSSHISTSQRKLPGGLPKTEHAALPLDSLTRLRENAPAPTPTTVGREISTASAALLKRFFTLSDSHVQELTQRLKIGTESLVDAVFALMDAGEDYTELQDDLNRSRARGDALATLSSKREDYQRLSGEKELLSAALKHAIRTQQGLEEANAANFACKAKMQQVETESLGFLEICQKEIESYVESLDRSENSTYAKSIAVHSTQATASPPKNSGLSIPSSSRIAQTQMVKSEMLPPQQTPLQQTVLRNEIGPTNVEAYFSPSKRGAGHTSVATKQPMSRPINRVQEDWLEDVRGDVNDDDMSARAQNLFSNRMGTPPAPFDNEDEEDFGMDDDQDILELAEDIENYEVPRHTSRQTTQRPVFAEVPRNSQRKASSASAKKGKRTMAKTEDPNMEDLFRFPWSYDVKATLKERFRLRGFRENQLQAINATLGGKDTFVLMPTGGGKSLCYQLPSLITCGKTLGVTVVVSPLLSLMEDQVQHLRRLHIQAFLINGETKAHEKNAVYEALNEDDVQQFIQLLYITPEMLSKSSKLVNTFEQLYRRQKLARLVIDEAHCVSQWGHDFRPDYKQIGDVRRRFPKVPLMALTATATENVKVDTIHNLGIDGCEVYMQSFNRPNLYYEVRDKAKGKEDIQNIANLIKEKHPKQTGIIYCLSRKDCEAMAKALSEQHSIKARHYHAGLEPGEKSDVQKQWQAGKCHVIVATIAFGMGIDKPDVRFVIHHTIPKSLEGYYQETGRAGRDQKQSGCYLFYGYKDASKIRKMIDEGDGSWEQKERQRLMLRNMIQYCENQSDCRRVQVLQYFNETFHRDDCGGQCDNCNSTSTFETVDFTSYGQQAVNLVRQVASDKVTVQHCIDVFCGSKAKKIADKGHSLLEECGAGSDLDRGDVERLFSRLLSEGAIREVNIVNKMGFANQYVELGFKRGKTTIEMQVRTTPKGKTKPAPKKRSKTDHTEQEIQNWKKTAGNSIAALELPLSTNVSSPIQAASSRKQAKKPTRSEVHGNGYYRDDFVVSDPEDGNYDEGDEDGSSYAFEPIRVAGQPHRERTKSLGPPITSDQAMERLDETHRAVVENFVQIARGMSKKISIDKNLSTGPFSDTNLRDMAIYFTETEDQMLAIRGINAEKVRLYGKQFCKLVKECHNSYEEMMADAEDADARNVIDLVSDEEDDYGSLELSDFEDEDGGESSAYFQPTKEVEAFNARFALSQSAALREAATPNPTKKAPPKTKKRNYRATASAGTATKGRFAGGSRYSSTSYNGYGPPSGVVKKKTGGKGPRGGEDRAGSSTFPARGSGRRVDNGGRERGRGGARGGGGISMMPT